MDPVFPNLPLLTGSYKNKLLGFSRLWSPSVLPTPVTDADTGQWKLASFSQTCHLHYWIYQQNVEFSRSQVLPVPHLKGVYFSFSSYFRHKFIASPQNQSLWPACRIHSQLALTQSLEATHLDSFLFLFYLFFWCNMGLILLIHLSELLQRLTWDNVSTAFV